MNELEMIGRTSPLFLSDLVSHERLIAECIQTSRFLVIGGAGSIGQAVAKEIFKRNPKSLHVVDISENNLVELVRDLRSTLGYISGDFRTFAVDCGSVEFDELFKRNSYDYVFNLSALKHVRSEKDPFTLMRMITVNIFNTVRIAQQCHRYGVKNYFCVSTDKAANPVNMMGASKRIMEMFLMRESVNQQISMARFANVAFSDGSLLHGFNQRLAKFQPISAPYDVKRYFVTAQESGELCLLSGLFGENRDIFFPKLSEKLHLITFSGIAKRYLESKGYECFECASEAEARDRSEELIASNYWPCFFFESDTTGEKDFEEFYTSAEEINMDRFQTVGVIKNEPVFHSKSLDIFTDAVQDLKNTGGWGKEDIVQLYNELIPDFGHLETGKYLDQRM